MSSIPGLRYVWRDGRLHMLLYAGREVALTDAERLGLESVHEQRRALYDQIYALGRQADDMALVAITRERAATNAKSE